MQISYKEKAPFNILLASMYFLFQERRAYYELEPKYVYSPP